MQCFYYDLEIKSEYRVIVSWITKSEKITFLTIPNQDNADLFSQFEEHYLSKKIYFALSDYRERKLYLKIMMYL